MYTMYMYFYYGIMQLLLYICLINVRVYFSLFLSSFINPQREHACLSVFTCSNLRDYLQLTVELSMNFTQNLRRNVLLF